MVKLTSLNFMMLNQNHEPIGESRIDKVRKFLSSPLSRKKQPSSHYKTFGTSLDTLMQRSPSESSVPFILTRICQYIEKSGLHHEGLFRISGNARSIERLKVAFDRTGDAPLEEGDVPSAAALLKLFLRELPDPIIPLSMHGEFLDAVKEKSKEESLPLLITLVKKLPVTNCSILNYLSHFLRQVSEMEEQNRMSASSLGIVFGPNLFRVTEDFVGLKEQSLTNQIVTYFITDYDVIFKHMVDEFSHHDHETPSVSMISSWPKSKALTQSMLSTWSLQPLSVSIPPIDDSFLPLASLAYSIGSDPACTLLVPEGIRKTEDSTVSNFEKSSQEQISTCAITLSENQINFLKSENSSTSNHVEHLSFKNTTSSHQSSCDLRVTSDVRIYPQTEPSNSQKDVSVSDDSSVSLLDSEKSKSSMHNLHSLEEKYTIGRKLEDKHKNYHRSHRRHILHHKKRHNADDEAKCVQSHSVYTVQNEDMEDFVVQNVQDGNANPLANSSHGTRHSWPVARKFQDEEDITLSPLPQQLRIATSIEAPLSPSAFRSYLSHRTIHLDPSLPPSPPVEQEDLVVGSTQEDIKGAYKHLPKTIHSLKKKIKQFEENFETLYGYKPSHTEKCNNAVMKKVLSDLQKARQELKQSKYQSSSWISDDTGDFPNAQNKTSKSTNTQDSNSGSKTQSGDSESISSFEESVINATESLLRQRKKEQRPEILEEMTKEQLFAEKLAIQKILLNFESFHGRPCSKSHRELMRPLYDRYRSVKRLITRSLNSLGNDPAELLPIMEHETMDFASVKKVLKVKAETNPNVDQTEKPFDIKSETSKIEKIVTEPQLFLHHNYHEFSLSQLLEEMKVTHDEKRKLRKVLRDFEDCFKQDNGRKAQREDKRVMESEYSEYKNAKAKLKLLEALVSKKKSSSIV